MRLDSHAGQGKTTCSQCRNSLMRHIQVGITTITIGKPEMQCRVDGSYRSPEILRDCPDFVWK